MGGARALGFIDAVVDLMEYMTGGNMMMTIVLMLWFSALLSAIIGAVPTTMVLVHVSVTLVGIYNNQAIYWALALGVVFGGLATPIGTAANIVMIGISKTTHFTIHFKEFVKIGLPTSILSLVLSTFYLIFRY
jgi:Na+/H+ antiporter NhaD/arsenite permease-like protein